jgi:hypothetical protein
VTAGVTYRFGGAQPVVVARGRRADRAEEIPQ